MRRSLPGIISLSRQMRRALIRRARKTRDSRYSKRLLIIALLAEGKTSVVIEQHLKVARAHVSRTARRYLEEGMAGLADRREENGLRKIDDVVTDELQRLLQQSPRECGWARSTWSRQLLVLEIERRLGIQLSRSTVGRGLKQLGARWGRARAMVLCPWRKAKRQRRLRQIRKILSGLSPAEEGFYVDEVDIDLNPRIGPDWMLPRRQTRILAPGTNQKAYLAGALNHRTGNIVWVEGDQKKSWLFLNLLRALRWTYRRARILHIVLDNYVIHKSRIVEEALSEWGQRIRLHFLPPYCPDENRIEMLWLQLHNNVTRNHRCPSLRELLDRVYEFLWNAIPFPGSQPSLAVDVAES